MPPHDALFKAAFEYPPAAISLLRAALPRRVLDCLDLSTLEVVKGTFVRKELRERFADLLLAVRTHRDPVLVQLLLEHKSFPDRFAIADLFDSVAAIWFAWRRRHRDATSLPRVVPILFHHGPRPWTQPKELRQLFTGDDELARVLAPLEPTLPVIFFDLGGLDDPAHGIHGIDDPIARCALFLLLVARRRDVIVQLKACGFDLLRHVFHGPEGGRISETMLRYLLEHLPEDVDPVEFATMVAERVDPEAESKMRTMRDLLIEQGIARGWAQGKAEGQSEGQTEGERLAILRVLGARFGSEADALEPRLARIRDGELLLRLVAIAATAPSLDAFARELRDG